MEEIINEDIITRNLWLSVKDALIHDEDITPSAIAKSIISKQNSPVNFKDGKPIFLDKEINSDNFVEKVLTPINQLKNEKAVAIATALRDELFGLNGAFKRGAKQKSVITEFKCFNY